MNDYGIDETLHQMCENRGYWIMTSQLDKTKKVIIVKI